jgi:uncharacterized protein
MAAVTAQDFIEMRVGDVRGVPGHPNPEACVVLLEERDGDHRMPVFIGREQAVLLAFRLQRVELARPGPYDLAVGAVRALGGRVREVRVDRLDEGTFYATVALDGRQGDAELDARPSDALNLALAAGAPIRVERGTAEAAVAHPDARAALDLFTEGEAGGSRALLEELLRPPPDPAGG